MAVASACENLSGGRASRSIASCRFAAPTTASATSFRRAHPASCLSSSSTQWAATCSGDCRSVVVESLSSSENVSVSELAASARRGLNV